MKKETRFLSMTIQRHYEKIFFDIVSMITHNIVLKLSWLKQHNSTVDWIKEVLTFTKCEYVIVIKSTHRQSSIINKRLNFEKIVKRELAFSTKNEQKKFDFADISRNQQNHEAKKIEENHAFFENLELLIKTKEQSRHKVFNIYNAWTELFQKK